jgi:hypothetical protein
VDWRGGIAREADPPLEPHGIGVDAPVRGAQLNPARHRIDA